MACGSTRKTRIPNFKTTPLATQGYCYGELTITFNWECTYNGPDDKALVAKNILARYRSENKEEWEEACKSEIDLGDDLAMYFQINRMARGKLVWGDARSSRCSAFGL